MNFRIVFILVFVVFGELFCQKRFVYEYRFVPDLAKKDITQVAYMNLDTDFKTSNFYNSNRLVLDSLIAKLKEVGAEKPNFPPYNANLAYDVTKNYKENKMVYHIRNGNVRFKLTENRPIKWKISDEMCLINNNKCQKAIATFGGRNWTAWFTPDIPVHDGPYKFWGLPGLIVKIEDDARNHSFELVEIKDTKSPNLLTDIGFEKEITKKQLADLMDNRSKNAVQNISEMMVKGNSINLILKDGNVLQFDGKAKNIDAEIEARTKKSNNPIELE